MKPIGLRRASNLLPTVSNVVQRLSQLIVLWFLATQTPSSVRVELVAVFGLLSTFAMLSDSGSGGYLLARKPEEINAGVVHSAAALHACLATLGLLSAAVYVGLFLSPSLDAESLWLLSALALTQQLDSLQRVVRSPELVYGDPIAYARPELLCAVLKIFAVGMAAVLAPDVVFALPVISAVFLVLAWLGGSSQSRRGRARRGQWRSTLSFGVGGTFNALFSQLPLLVGGAMLAAPSLASLTILFRLTQALEVAPGTMSLQLIPPYRDRRATWIRDALTFAGGSAVLALLMLALLPVLEALLEMSLPWVAAALLGLGFVLRAVNYQLTAWLLARDAAKRRLILVALLTAALTPVGVALTAAWGINGAAAASILLEGALMVALVRTAARLHSPR